MNTPLDNLLAFLNDNPGCIPEGTIIQLSRDGKKVRALALYKTKPQIRKLTNPAEPVNQG